MIRGTTPTVILKLKNTDMDLTELKGIYITIRQGEDIIVTKNLEDEGISLIGKDTIEVYLSQKDTLGFRPGAAQLQLRGITHNGVAFATNIVEVIVKDILLEGEIT